MIFVTLGTHELSFKRLLDYLEKMDIKEEVVIQSGNTPFKSEKYKVIPFLEVNEFNHYMKKSNLVITHGGVGSIFTGLKLGKKVITMPRLSKYNEHNDDHQLEVCEKFHNEGFSINCMDYESLEKAINSYKDIDLKKYKFDNSKILNYLDKIILDND